MILLKVNKRTYGLSFAHTVKEAFFSPSKRQLKRESSTTLTLSEWNKSDASWNEVSTTTVQYDGKETFSLGKARKYALQEAIKLLGLTQQERTKFWEEYFQKVGKPSLANEG